MKPLTKADLLRQFADDQEDEIFGDIENVDFGPGTGTAATRNKVGKSTRRQYEKEKEAKNGGGSGMGAGTSTGMGTGGDDDDAIETLKVNQLNLNTHNSPSFQLTPKNGGSSSPTKSTKSSGKRITRDALSEYSEGNENNDTDITSEFSQDEFEGWDECFNKNNQNQSIYQQMNQRLIARKVAQQREAEREQQELIQMRQQQQQHQQNKNTRVLLFKESPKSERFKDGGHKLTNENLSLLDQLETERTINYEYTRDDYDEFEEGFNEAELEESISKIQPLRRIQLQQLHMQQPSSSYGTRKLSNKQSMPSLARNNVSIMKKFKSSMDLHGRINEENEEDIYEQPQFNYNNRVIKRLDRIPSYYSKPALINTEDRNQILDKFKETKSKHIHGRNRKMGNLRHLKPTTITTTAATDIPIQHQKSAMRFNKQKSVWEGNEVDLLRFEKKPSLITSKDIQPRSSAIGTGLSCKKQGNMLYDEKNLRWINLEEGGGGEDEMIFDDIPDLTDPVETLTQYNVPQQLSQLSQRGSPSKKKNNNNDDICIVQSSSSSPPPPPPLPLSSRRGLCSQYTQRTVSTATSHTASSSTQSDHNYKHERKELKLSDKLVDKFLKEEQKIERKIGHWFIGTNEAKRDYYWEIRKMVTEED